MNIIYPEKMKLEVMNIRESYVLLLQRANPSLKLLKGKHLSDYSEAIQQINNLLPAYDLSDMLRKYDNPDGVKFKYVCRYNEAVLLHVRKLDALIISRSDGLYEYPVTDTFRSCITFKDDETGDILDLSALDRMLEKILSEYAYSDEDKEYLKTVDKRAEG